MKEKKVKLEITLTEREAAILERYYDNPSILVSEAIEQLPVPDEIKTEEERRSAGKYEMYFDRDGALLLTLPHRIQVPIWVEPEYDDHPFEPYEDHEQQYRRSTYRLENGKFEKLYGVWLEEGEEIIHSSRAFDFFEEEIYYFSKMLLPGQRVENGLLIMKEVK